MVFETACDLSGNSERKLAIVTGSSGATPYMKFGVSRINWNAGEYMGALMPATSVSSTMLRNPYRTASS